MKQILTEILDVLDDVEKQQEVDEEEEACRSSMTDVGFQADRSRTAGAVFPL